MSLSMLKAQLRPVNVTQCSLHDEGSVSIDWELLDALGILPHEKVEVWSVTNESKVPTYALEAPRGSKTIGVDAAEARQHAPAVVLLSPGKEIKRPV